jgi:hypothetical protein
MEGQAGFQMNEHSSTCTPVRAAISVSASLEEIERIGDGKDGGCFCVVVEFWVENRLMLELLTAAIAPTYL